MSKELTYDWTLTEVSHSPADAWKDLQARKNKIAELRLELKILQRAYDELYKERYGDPPTIYAHV